MRMFLLIQPDGKMREIFWPVDVRVPTAGEIVLVGAVDAYRVLDVQWEIEQGEDELCAVQLRVISL